MQLTPAPAKKKSTAGFTLVELVVVLVLIGILSVYAAPKFAGRSVYSELTVRQDVKQSIRYAQQLAMSRTAETFSFVATANQIDVRNGATSVDKYPKDIPSDVTLSNTNIVFDRFGAPIGGGAAITITGTQTLTVTIETTTGFAHE